jgi:hypothetical protein
MDNIDSLKRPFESDLYRRFHEQDKTLVIVDDDPTGTQTRLDHCGLLRPENHIATEPFA